ncbi:MAG: T9SS type A sorting domain-containing protein [Flavobacteriales bacterium]|nr:T9SS type A sorting domain-containing protein [Flavobacteriales bacterium]
MKKLCFAFFQLLITFYAQAQQTSALNYLGGSGQDNIRSCTIDELGNVYILGSSYGSLNVNGTTYPTGMGSTSFTYLMKLDANRNYIWHKVLTYTNSIVSNDQHIAVDGSGNVYITDSHFTSATIEGVPLPVFTGSIGYFTLKLNSYGDIVWVKPEGGNSLTIKDDNTLVIFEYRNQSDYIGTEQITNETGTVYFMDFDGNYVQHFQVDSTSYAYEIIVGMEENGLFYGFRKSSNMGISSELIMIKTDITGNIIESKLINVTDGNDTPSSVVRDSSTGHYYIAGKFHNRVPFDALTGTYQTTAMLLHLDEHFNLMSALELGPPLGLSGGVPAIRLQAFEGNVYFGGLMNTFSLVPWTSFGQNHYLYPVDEKLIYAKFSGNLLLKWYRELPELYYVNFIQPMISTFGVSFLGRTSDMLYDTFWMDASGSDDIFIIDVQDDDQSISTVNGQVFIDTDADGVLTSSDLPGPYQSIRNSEIPDMQFYSGSDGQFEVLVDSGDQYLHIGQLPLYWVYATPDSVLVHVDSINQQLDEVIFGIAPLPDVQDLTITLNPTSPCRIGQEVFYTIEICNQGTVDVEGNALLLLDPNLEFVSASPTVIASGDSILLPYDTLEYGECLQYQITTYLSPIPALLGQNLHLYVEAGPLGTDTSKFDNYEHLYQTVTGSYDPNDISVLPSCDIAESFITDNKELDYLIRFQNTGNDTAFNITITCPISPYLDPSTIDYRSSSHDAIFYVVDDLLRIEFQNILLPDSFVNEQGSHGYFRFAVKPLASMIAGNSIQETASIFFDFNPPVITNTATTTLQNGSDLVHFQAFAASCSGLPDGELLIDAPCLGNQFQVQIDGGDIIDVSSGTLESISYGPHNMVVLSDNSVIFDGEVHIPIVSTPIGFDITPSTCSTFHSGAIGITGGCLPESYEVSIDGSAFSVYPDGMISNLDEGIYEIRIAGDGDTTTHVVEVGALIDGNGVEIESNAATCPLAADGSLNISNNCFASPLYYSLDSGELILLENGVIEGLSSGSHQLLLTDGTDEREISFDISLIHQDVLSNFNTISSSCPASADGSITFDLNCVGLDFYYSLDQNISLPLLGNTIAGLSVGNHHIEIFHDAVSVYSEDFLIETTESVSAEIANISATCINQSDGQVVFQVHCANPPYFISVDGGNFVESMESAVYGLSTGMHQFVIATGTDTLYINDIVITTPPISFMTEETIIPAICPELPGQISFSNSCIAADVTLTITVNGENYYALQNEPIDVMPGMQYFVVTAGDYTLQNSSIVIGTGVGPDTEIATDAQSIYVVSPSQGDTYQWFNCQDDQPINGANSAIFMPTESGSYYVEISGASGCVVKSGCVSITIDGIVNLADEMLVVYPNPTSGDFNMYIPQSLGNWTFTIYNATGKMIEQRLVSGSVIIGHIETSGIYHLTLTNDQKILKTTLIID